MKKILSTTSFAVAVWATLTLTENGEFALALLPLIWVITWAVIQLKRKPRAATRGKKVVNFQEHHNITPIYFQDDYRVWRY